MFCTYDFTHTLIEQSSNSLFLFQPSNSAGRFGFPWHDSVVDARQFIQAEVFTAHPVMRSILFHFKTQ